MRFENKVCLVTGSTSGIGQAAALQFAREGARVMILGTNTQKGDAVVRQIWKP